MSAVVATADIPTQKENRSLANRPAVHALPRRMQNRMPIRGLQAGFSPFTGEIRVRAYLKAKVPLGRTSRRRTVALYQGAYVYGPKRRKRTTFREACHVLWACGIMGWTNAQAADEIDLHPGTVSAILRGKLYPVAYPIPLPPPLRWLPANDNQGDFGF